MTVQPPIDFRQLRILVVHPRDGDGDMMFRQLQRAGSHVELAWPPPPELPASIDAVFLLIGAEPKGWLAGPPQCALIGVIGRSDAGLLRPLVDCNPQAVISKPIDPAGLLANLVVAHNSFRYEKRLLSKIGKLEDTLRSIRKVEQAKSILMKQKRIQEPEAYRFLRQQAMNKRMSIGAVASAIIAAAEVLHDESR